MVIAIALAAAVFVIAFSLAFQTYRRTWRHKRLKGLELTPNCLMTRYPIAFLSGRKSLFRLFDHWNDIPVYLREHGYEVLVIEPLRKTDPVDALTSILQSLGQGKIHLIADSSLEDDIHFFATTSNAQIASITLVKNPHRPMGFTTPKTSPSAKDFRPCLIPIETFELHSSFPKTASAQTALINAIERWMLCAHNVFFSSRKPVDPIETGDLIDIQGWSFEARFLELAISLAERDAQCFD